MRKISRLLLKNMTAALLCAALLSGCAAPGGEDGTAVNPKGADGTIADPIGADSTEASSKVDDTVLAPTLDDSRE